MIDPIKVPLKAEVPTLITNPWDRAMGRVLKAVVDQLPNTKPEADLLADSFFAMYKGSPTPTDEIPSERSVNHALMSWFLGGDPHRSTVGNIPASLASGSILWASLCNDESIKKALEEQDKANQAAEEAKELERQASEEAQRLQEQAKSGNEPTEEDAQTLKDLLAQAEEKRKEADQSAAAANEIVEKIQNSPLKKQAMVVAKDAAEKEGEKVKAIMQSWGVEPGTDSTTDIDTILEMAKSSDFSMLGQLLGRAYETASKQIAAVQEGKTGSIPEVELTKEPDKLFVEELFAMSDSAPLPMQAMKLRDFANTGLLGWQPLEDKKQSGSFISLVDRSGSIGDETSMFESAIVLGVARAVQDGIEPGRVYEAYSFDTKITCSVTSADDWRQHMAWASNYSGGGTDIGLALNKAVERAKVMHASGIEGVDIFLVSDGICRVDERVYQRLDELKEEIGTRLAYVHICTWGGEVGDPKLVERSDVHIVVKNTHDFKNAFEDIVKQVSTMIADK